MEKVPPPLAGFPNRAYLQCIVNSKIYHILIRNRLATTAASRAETQ